MVTWLIKISAGFLLLSCLQTCDTRKQELTSSPENILLKDFKPVSVFNIPVTRIQKAKFPAMDYFGLPMSIGYHWPMYGLGLEEDILRKIYRDMVYRTFNLYLSKME